MAIKFYLPLPTSEIEAFLKKSVFLTTSKGHVYIMAQWVEGDNWLTAKDRYKIVKPKCPLCEKHLHNHGELYLLTDEHAVQSICPGSIIVLSPVEKDGEIIDPLVLHPQWVFGLTSGKEKPEMKNIYSGEHV